MPRKMSMVEQVARIIDGDVAFACTPSMYGLDTEAELEERTLVGGARAVARDKARKIIKLLRERT
jgi:hypothetical protein